MKPVELELKRPIDEATFETLCRRMENFIIDPDDYITVSLKNDLESLLFVQAIRHGRKIHVELGFTLRNRSEKALLLGADLSMDKAKAVFRELLVEGCLTSEMELLEAFHKLNY